MSLQDRLNRLLQMQHDLRAKLVAEMWDIGHKRARLVEIRNLTLLGKLTQELKSEEERLKIEIIREVAKVNTLMRILKQVEYKIQLLQNQLQKQQYTVRPPAKTPREQEIQWLLEELRAVELGIVQDGKHREAILRRLRQLGYQI